MMTCPQCGEAATQDVVDVGPCSVPAGPYGCEHCGWVQNETDVDRELSDTEAAAAMSRALERAAQKFTG